MPVESNHLIIFNAFSSLFFFCLFNREQFIVAVHLVNEQIASGGTRELPATLPPALIPPSLRPVALEPSAYEESNRILAEIDRIRR